MKNTVSKKIAKFLFFVDILLGIILVIALFLLFPFFVFLLIWWNIFSLPVFIVIFGLTGFGFHLMRGYNLHFRDVTHPKKAKGLWIKSIIFNSILMFVFSFAFSIEGISFFNDEHIIFNEQVMAGTIFVWLLLALVLSIFALFSINETKKWFLWSNL